MDSVGRAIKAVEMEGWSSNGASDPGHHISTEFPGTPFVANSIPNGFGSPLISSVLASNFSISVCSFNSSPIKDQSIKAIHRDIMEVHEAQSIEDRGGALSMEGRLVDSEDVANSSQMVSTKKGVDIMLERLGFSVHDKNG